MLCSRSSYFFFFFNDTATTEIYTLSLHDALPILGQSALDRFCHRAHQFVLEGESYRKRTAPGATAENRSEEHTSELQSRLHLVCRLLLEKKKHDVQRKGSPPHSHRHIATQILTDQ